MVISEIQKAAKAQGLKLPDNPFVLKLEKPNPLFLLLKSPDKARRTQFEKLSSALAEGQVLVITGTVPEQKEKTKSSSVVLFLLNFKPEKTG